MAFKEILKNEYSGILTHTLSFKRRILLQLSYIPELKGYC